MQEHGGDEATEAIVAAERSFYVKLEVDWNRTGNYGHALSNLSAYANNIQTDRSLAGSAPAEIMLIEGASAAELTFDIGGEQNYDDYLNFVAVFSPYNGLSPMYNLDPIGCEVRYSIGIDTAIGIVWYPQFIGNIRTITPNRDTNTVTFSALDRVEKLRVPVRFPVWAMSAYNAQRGYELAQLMNSQWVIDHCLRFGDTSSTPYRPMYEYEFTKSDPDRDKGIRFWLTGTGAAVPSIGSMDENTSQGYPDMENGFSPMYYQNGLPHPSSPEPETPPIALASMGDDNSGWNLVGGYGSSFLNKYWGLDRNTDNILSAHYIGFTITETGDNGDWWRGSGNLTTVVRCGVGYHIELLVTLYQGSIRAEIRNYLTTGGVVSSWYSVPAADFTTVAVKFGLGPGAAASKYWILLNGVQVGTGTFADWTSYLDGNFDPYTGYVSVTHQAGINDVFWGNRWSGSASTPTDADIGLIGGRRQAKYAAVLDPGKNYLTFLPAASADDAWSTITAVASAELGSVFWDENGVFHFWNRDRIVDLQLTPVRTLSLDDVEGLQITNSLDSIRNVVTAESKKSISQTETVWQSTSIDDFYVPGNTRKYFIFYPTNIQAVYPLQIPRYRTSAGSPTTNPVWDENVLQGYVGQWLLSGVWQEDNSRTSGVEVYTYMNEDDTLTIEVFNGYSEDFRFATGDAGESASPAFRLGGSAISQDQTAILTAQDTSSIGKFGRRNFALSGDWVQWQPAVADQLVDFILPRTVAPIPTTDAVTIAGDPRLQLGDCIEVVDKQGMGELMQMQIYGIQRNYSRDNGLTDTLTVEMIQPPRIGIWDSAQYGLWDETFIWSD